MRIGPQQRPLFLFWCWLYLVLGAFCLIAGLLILLAPYFLGSTGDNGMRAIGIVCVIFGLMRMANSAWHLRQIRRSRS